MTNFKHVGIGFKGALRNGNAQSAFVAYRKKYQKLKNFIWVAVILTDNQLLFYLIGKCEYRTPLKQKAQLFAD